MILFVFADFLFIFAKIYIILCHKIITRNNLKLHRGESKKLIINDNLNLMIMKKNDD